MNSNNCIILLMGIAGSGKRTIAQAISKQADFKFVPCDTWIAPILSLLGTDGSIMWDLDEKGWAKLNEARDLIFSAMTDLCPKSANFVLTFEMLDNNPYHQLFYDRVLEVVKKRNAHFFPVRLICEEKELLQRVQSQDRKQYFKTQDVELIRGRVRDEEVFYTKHKNELSLDVTHLAPDEAAKQILEFLQSGLG